MQTQYRQRGIVRRYQNGAALALAGKGELVRPVRMDDVTRCEGQQIGDRAPFRREAARAGVPAGAAVAAGAEELVVAGGVRRGRVAGRDAAAAELLAVGRGRVPGRPGPVRRRGSSATRRRCWRSDETGFLKKGRMSAGRGPACIPGRRGGSRTARSGCSWPTSRRTGAGR